MEHRALIGRCPRLGLQPLELLDKPLLLCPDPLLETELPGLVPAGELLLLRGGLRLRLRLGRRPRHAGRGGCCLGARCRLGTRHQLRTAGSRPCLFGRRGREGEVRRRSARLAARLPLLGLPLLLGLPPIDAPSLARLHPRSGPVQTIAPAKLKGQGARAALERRRVRGLRRRRAFDEDGFARLA